MQDGTERDFDLIVLGAGFKVSHYFWPVEYRGRGGMTLEKGWEKDGARSYLGMVMPSYPNLFTLYGPNHQPRGGSLPSYAEIWSRYMASSLVGMIEKGTRNFSRSVMFCQQSSLDWATSFTCHFCSPPFVTETLMLTPTCCRCEVNENQERSL